MGRGRKKREEKQLATIVEEPKVVKVDLGCGSRKQEGYIGVDSRADCKPDIVYDLDIAPWPFEDNSVDEVYCSHYVEHCKDLIGFMEELYRILKVGATAKILAPYYSSIRCWQDPYHVRAISERTFLYFNKEWRDTNLLGHYPIKADFDFTYGYVIMNEWANRDEQARMFAIAHYINVVDDIHVVLTKRG